MYNYSYMLIKWILHRLYALLNPYIENELSCSNSKFKVHMKRFSSHNRKDKHKKKVTFEELRKYRLSVLKYIKV